MSTVYRAIAHKGNKARVTIVQHGNPGLWTVSKTWGKFHEPAADVIKKYGAMEASRILDGPVRHDFDLQHWKSQDIVLLWERRMIKEGYTITMIIGEPFHG